MKTHPNRLTFIVPGDLLSTTADAIRTELTTLLQSADGLETLEIDLRGASMVDSVGLNLIVWVWKSVRAKGASLCVRITSADIERTFRFTRLSSHIEVVREPA